MKFTILSACMGFLWLNLELCAPKKALRSQLYFLNPRVFFDVDSEYSSMKVSVI